jgi:hypothetical protein
MTFWFGWFKKIEELLRITPPDNDLRSIPFGRAVLMWYAGSNRIAPGLRYPEVGRKSVNLPVTP